MRATQSPQALIFAALLLRLLHPIALLLSPIGSGSNHEKQEEDEEEQQQFLENLETPTLWPAEDLSVLSLQRATTFYEGRRSVSTVGASTAAAPKREATVPPQPIRFCASLPDMTSSCWVSGGDSCPIDGVIAKAADQRPRATQAAAKGLPLPTIEEDAASVVSLVAAESSIPKPRGLQRIAAATGAVMHAVVLHVLLVGTTFRVLLQQQPLLLLLTCIHCSFNAAMQGNSLAFVKHQLHFSHDQVRLLLSSLNQLTTNDRSRQSKRHTKERCLYCICSLELIRPQEQPENQLCPSVASFPCWQASFIATALPKGRYCAAMKASLVAS